MKSNIGRQILSETPVDIRVKVSDYSSRIISEFAQLGTELELRRVANRMVLAAKISDTLVERGLSVRDFGCMIGKSTRTINYWLSGGYNFTLNDISDIECVLNIKLLGQ